MNIEDKAQEHEALEWTQRNQAREVIRFEPGQPGYGPAECICGNEMHPVRRAWGFKNCVPCASLTEVRRR